ncbi:MAG: FAD-binding oxidoreductase, partial [Planktomarina sp.]
MTLLNDLEALPFDIRATPATGSYAEEPRGRFESTNGVVAAPADTDGVAAVVKYANAHGIAVVPYSGGTGLVGGQVAQTQTDHIVLSTHRMIKLRALDAENATMTVDAGMILADVHSTAADADTLFPLSLAAEGSARIGGILATNAGGVNVLRYGNARDLCLGLEVVMADGSIWNGLSGLRKDNTGYDLRHLMIGSEGSLGIITAATLRLFPNPRTRGTAMFAVPSAEAALHLLRQARGQFGETVSAFELIHRRSFEFLSEAMPDVRLPFADFPVWAVLLDVANQSDQPLTDAIGAFFETAFDAGLVSDAVLAQSDTQRTELWSVREHIPLANRAIGAVSSHDISVPVSSIPAFIEQAGQAIASLGPMRVNCFGHVGDGNLHYNIFPDAGKTRDDYDHLRGDIKRTVHDIVHSFQGSV